MTVLEPGPGMGFFTLELARRVGPLGRVVCVDIQAPMLERLRRRAREAELFDRLDIRLAAADSMGIADLEGEVDFTLAFAVVHEFPDAKKFFSEVATVSKQGATVLLAEPRGHVKKDMFDAQLQAAVACGLSVESRPEVRGSLAAVLRKE
jgi:ubiquinone/menaquinone biosynthesis C-methylase UbiE